MVGVFNKAIKTTTATISKREKAWRKEKGKKEKKFVCTNIEVNFNNKVGDKVCAVQWCKNLAHGRKGVILLHPYVH